MHIWLIVRAVAIALTIGAAPTPTPREFATPAPTTAPSSAVATLKAIPATAAVGAPITFSFIVFLSSSQPSIGGGFSIDFLDGTTQAIQPNQGVTHAFSAPGIYVVRLLRDGAPTNLQVSVMITPAAQHVTATALSWPDGQSQLSLAAGAQLPHPVAYVRVDGAGTVSLQWLVDGVPLTTATQTLREAGPARFDLVAPLPRKGSHAITLRVLAPAPSFGGPTPAPAISYVFTETPPTITFTSESPPELPSSLPQYQLVPTASPERFVADLVASEWPDSSGLAPYRTKQFVAAFSQGRMVAYVDRATGDAELFSDLANLPASGVDSAAALSVAQRLFKDPNIIPHDSSTYDTSEASLEANTESFDAPNANESAQAAGVLTFVSLRRYVGTARYPVFGIGSRALVAVDGSGRVKAFLRRWRTAKLAGAISRKISPSAIRPRITAQLSPFEPASTAINVEHIGIGYYDGGGSKLQPVVYYLSTIQHRTDGAHRPASDHYVGYVPFGAPVERIPMTLPRESGGVASSAGTAPIGDPTVAIYVIRNAESAWHENADEFWSGIAESPNAVQFTRREQLDAQPSFFLREMNKHVNGANISVMEGHGGWWTFATLGKDADVVDVHDIARGGYGAVSGGNLAYWIIHACEVIPSQSDAQKAVDGAQDAFSPWWPVFGGLREVLGYRTEMDLDDDVERSFGLDIGRGGIALSSWFNQIASAPIYQAQPVCESGNLNAQVTCGRGSAIVVAGHQDDAMLTDYLPLATRARKLVNYWMTDR